MSQEQVTALFSDDGSEVALETAEDVVCELHCNRLFVLARRTEDAVGRQPIRMLTTKPDFPPIGPENLSGQYPALGFPSLLPCKRSCGTTWRRKILTQLRFFVTG